MKDTDLGIYNNEHNSLLTGLEGECLDILQSRGAGMASAIPATDLARRLGLIPTLAILECSDAGKRDLRRLINHLIISHEIPIICQAGFKGGYYLAGEPAEVSRFYATFHRRAMTGLIKASRGKKAAFVEILKQLSLGFDEPETDKAIEKLRLTRDEDPVPAWVHVTTSFLDKISADPERYAAEIRQLQEKYGEIFIKRQQVELLKEKTAEFQKLLSEIG